MMLQKKIKMCDVMSHVMEVEGTAQYHVAIIDQGRDLKSEISFVLAILPCDHNDLIRMLGVYLINHSCLPGKGTKEMIQRRVSWIFVQRCQGFGVFKQLLLWEDNLLTLCSYTIDSG